MVWDVFIDRVALFDRMVNLWEKYRFENTKEIIFDIVMHFDGESNVK